MGGNSKLNKIKNEIQNIDWFLSGIFQCSIEKWRLICFWHFWNFFEWKISRNIFMLMVAVDIEKIYMMFLMQRDNNDWRLHWFFNIIKGEWSGFIDFICKSIINKIIRWYEGLGWIYFFAKTDWSIASKRIWKCPAFNSRVNRLLHTSWGRSWLLWWRSPKQCS